MRPKGSDFFLSNVLRFWSNLAQARRMKIKIYDGGQNTKLDPQPFVGNVDADETFKLFLAPQPRTEGQTDERKR